MSAHKFYGPKGIGALFIRNGIQAIPLEPLVYGGGQERSVRSGTSNVPAIVGMGAAAERCASVLSQEAERLAEMRDSLESQLVTALEDSWINGANSARLPNTSSMTIPEVDADGLALAMPEVMLGVGSACSTGALEPSHVLQAIGLSRTEAASTVRISLGRFNSESEIPIILDQIVQTALSQKNA